MFYFCVKNIGLLLFRIFLRLEIQGQENIPKDGPMLLACNHISLLDPPVVGAACTRNVHWMAKEELFVPVLGTIYRWLGAFPVKRGAADRNAIKHGIEIMENNEVLAIFPEGTRSKTGELGEFHAGSFKIATKTQCPIVIANITNVMDIKKRFLFKITNTKIYFLKTLYYEDYKDMNTQELAEYCKNLIAQDQIKHPVR